MCEKTHIESDRDRQTDGQTNGVFEKNREEVRDTDRQKQRLCENATKRKRDRHTKYVRKTKGEIERQSM